MQTRRRRCFKINRAVRVLGARRLRLALLLTAAALALAPAMPAQTAPRVLVVSSADDELGRKIRAEAASVGLTVLASAHYDPKATHSELLARHEVVALIQVMSGDRLDIYVGPAGGRSSYSRSLRRRPDDSESFASRAVEQVRARLVELRILAPATGETASSPKPEASTPDGASSSDQSNGENAPAAREPQTSVNPEIDRGASRGSAPAAPGPKLWFSAGMAGTAPAGGMGATAHGAFGLRVEPDAAWSVSAYGLLPATESELTGAEGEAEVSASLFLAQFGYSPFDTGNRWLVDAGMGAGLLALGVRGQAQAPFTGRDDRLLAGLYFLHASAAWSATSWFRLRAGLSGGLSAPRPVVRFDGRDVAAWGRLYGSAALTAEFGLALSAQEEPP